MPYPADCGPSFKLYQRLLGDIEKNDTGHVSNKVIKKDNGNIGLCVICSGLVFVAAFGFFDLCHFYSISGQIASRRYQVALASFAVL
tara:strand:+ start:988 stop:1248 length:261 start_codon:yes stop_codon:yes gene_type:complete